MRPTTTLLTMAVLLSAGAATAQEPDLVTSPGANMVTLASGFKFTEGPAVDAAGNIYFSDIPNNRIHKWTVRTRELSTFLEDSGGANGLFFDRNGALLACQTRRQRVVAIAPDKQVTVLAERFGDKPFNKPNDLWIDPSGGVYFSDPGYGLKKLSQDGEHVYYIHPDRQQVSRVAKGFERPNGLVGTADGKTLYITDRGAYETWVYKIGEDGSLSDKKLFCREGSDGMTLDEHGNLYMTPKKPAIHVYDPSGELREKIPLPALATNLVIGGPAGRTLFVTARKLLLAIELRVRGQHWTDAAK